MSEAFELADYPEAREFLQKLPPGSKQKGETLFRGGRVTQMEVLKPGRHFLAQVWDLVMHKVEIEFTAGPGWQGVCDCNQPGDCAHIFAVMRALLVEGGAVAVRNLSAGVVRATPAFARKIPSEPALLASRLASALGRSLKPPETKFVKKVAAAYKRVSANGQITNWDFLDLGFHVAGYSWNTLHIWPEMPSGEYEFWLYIAYYLQQRGFKIPEFMEAITDTAPVRERLARWAREREVHEWKDRFSTLDVRRFPPSADSEPASPTDLRLVIDQEHAFLEWLRPGAAAFEALKGGHFAQLNTEIREGRLTLTSEAEVLWQIFSHRSYSGSGLTWRYAEAEEQDEGGLRRILLLPLLESRVVDVNRQPLARPSQPLRWDLTPAATDDDDYRLRLAQTDGRAVPPILATFTGKPTLYLTAHAIFRGPETFEGVLKAEEENRIPAAAVEQPAGLSFLQALGVDLPARVRERVRVLPVQIAIRCHLASTYPGSGTEDCIIQVWAEAENGHRQVWTGTGWLEESDAETVPQPSREQIFLYDTAPLRRIPPLFAPLSLRLGGRNDEMSVRVTRKFPEQFTAWLKTIPADIRLQLDGDLASLASPEVAGRVKLEVSENEIDWFDLRVVLDVSDTTLSPEEIKLLLRAKGGFVRLEGKGWRRLQYDLSDDENNRLAQLGLNAQELSDEPQRLHALQLADDAARAFIPEQQVKQIQRRASEIKARVSPALPKGVKADLRAYQLDGFHFLAYLTTNRFGGILADDMGLGKTLQTLAWLVWLREQGKDSSNGGDGEPGPSLVVCPKSVMDNWRAEVARFTPELKVKVWSPADLPLFKNRLKEADLHVINYSHLRLLGESLTGVRWLALILDEGQYIKNPSSQTAQVARGLTARERLVLSGTPIENRLLDLWSLMSFAMPGVLGSRAQFGRLYDTKGDPFARRRLSARVRPFLLRRTKTQVASDLPDRIEEDLFCEIEGDQKALYRAELKRAQQLLLQVQSPSELAKHRFHFLTSLLRLRQICCHPKLVNAQAASDGAKVDAMLEQLEPLMEEGQKVLVFSQFVELLELLKPHLAAREWPLFYLSGATEHRGELVRQFQEAEGAAVFLISLKAGGFGLNLTAASYVILFDPWWNPAVENQAIDRTHRIGQTNKVIAYRLLIKSSIEEKIRALQRRKKALAEDVLGEEKFAQSLTMEDLHFLFAD